ncbi:hypothetical protein JCM6882_002646 [Rhodosporidiobolus microsporus]
MPPLPEQQHALAQGSYAGEHRGSNDPSTRKFQRHLDSFTNKPFSLDERMQRFEDSGPPGEAPPHDYLESSRWAHPENDEHAHTLNTLHWREDEHHVGGYGEPAQEHPATVRLPRARVPNNFYPIARAALFQPKMPEEKWPRPAILRPDQDLDAAQSGPFPPNWRAIDENVELIRRHHERPSRKARADFERRNKKRIWYGEEDERDVWQDPRVAAERRMRGESSWEAPPRAGRSQ